MVAATAEEDRLLVFHPRDVGVGLQVGVQLALLGVVLLHLGVLALDVLLFLMGLAAVFHEVGQVLGRGHGFFVVDDDVVGQLGLQRLLGVGRLFLGFLFGDDVVFIFFFHWCSLFFVLSFLQGFAHAEREFHEGYLGVGVAFDGENGIVERLFDEFDVVDGDHFGELGVEFLVAGA